MITTAFTYITALLFIAGSLTLLEQKTRWKLFEYLPAIVLLYFSVMVFSTLGLWHKTESINGAYQTLKTNLLPAMIFLMLLDADLRQISKLGSKMLLAFFAAALSIGLAFVLTFTLFLPYLQPEAWKTFAVLSGSWMGGTGNMAAVQAALNVPDASMGYTLLIDSIDYAMWVMLLLALVPFAKRFNHWVGADSKVLEKVSAGLAKRAVPEVGEKTTQLLILLSGSMLVSVITQAVAAQLPVSTFFTT
ncbi:MAG: putative membrane protein, partial [Paraglaciecola sp.]